MATSSQDSLKTLLVVHPSAFSTITQKKSLDDVIACTRAEPCIDNDEQQPAETATKAVAEEANRLQAKYNAERTQQHYQHLRNINNTVALRMIGI